MKSCGWPKGRGKCFFFWIILTVWFCYGTHGKSASRVGDIFEVPASAPSVLKTWGEPERVISENGQTPVILERLVYGSEYKGPDGFAKTNQIFAVLARPDRPEKSAGILLLHGGMGHADSTEALRWAKKGYLVLAPELPGIADPKKAVFSIGEWREKPYGADRWTASPDARASVIFQAITAALQGFYLLSGRPEVVTDRIGVMGSSWGGYTTLMVCGILGDKVRAGFSNYGSGFFPMTSFRGSLQKMSDMERLVWLEQLDAGGRVSGIRASLFLAAAANDKFFFPPAVEATLSGFRPGSTAGVVYAPNAHHQIPLPGGVNEAGGYASQAALWFARHLQGEGPGIPSFEFLFPATLPTMTARLLPASSSCQVFLVWSLPPLPGRWAERKWQSRPVLECSPGLYQVRAEDIPSEPGTAWFLLARDEIGQFSVSTRMLGAMADFEGSDEGK